MLELVVYDSANHFRFLDEILGFDEHIKAYELGIARALQRLHNMVLIN